MLWKKTTKHITLYLIENDVQRHFRQTLEVAQRYIFGGITNFCLFWPNQSWALAIICESDFSDHSFEKDIQNFLILFVEIPIEDNKITLNEHFIEFVPFNESSCEGLTEVTMTVLTKQEHELDNCRSQGW